MKALVIGATGATGKFLTEELLKDKYYTAVAIFVRKPTGRQHPKLTEYVIDFSNVDYYREEIKGDILFSCLGTTLKAAGSKEEQWKIDFDIPAAFAAIAKQNDVHSFVLVSSTGADSKSGVFYSKMKGKLEEKIAELNFNQYIIFKPGPLLREGSDRAGEKIMVKTLRLLNSIGLLRKYKPLPTELLAEKLAKAPKILKDGITVIELEKIVAF
jgi:uncharacterized protein YbjT (DUF2867 family)